MRPLPLRWRLTMAFAVVIAVLLGATGVFVHQRVASSLDRGVNRALHARAADVAALAQQSDSGLREARGAGGSGHRAELAQLIGAHGRVIDRTPGLPTRPLIGPASLAAAGGGARVQNGRLADGVPVRLLAQRVRAQDQLLTVVVGQSLQDRNRALHDLTGVLLVGGPIALVLATIAGFLLTGAALRPVEAMRRQAAAMSATNLQERLTPAPSNDELGRLGRTLNEMLVRIEASVTHERAFVSDASHELRSPLTMLRTELELIAVERPTGAALQRAVGSAIDETDQLTRLAEDLLLLARADDRQLDVITEPVPAEDLVRAAADRGRRSRRGPHVHITADAEPGVGVLADPDRTGRALDNLVANAQRHAVGRVTLTARARPPFVELHVVDDGPGFPPGFLPQAWERFARADAGRTEDGTGLGLAIVRSIAELQGGYAGAVNRAGSGADVWIALRQAADVEVDRGAVGQLDRVTRAGLEVVRTGTAPRHDRSSPACRPDGDYRRRVTDP
ncbi:MAG: integral rane sensor signal transduction histidine kinase [Solirubrobacterales bacterium]|nr:integral rane sensor signal transduction histidine kinase [Solirubrobacterales bacterium]